MGTVDEDGKGLGKGTVGRDGKVLEIIRQHLLVTGDVQGVGFRYRARYAAEGLGVTGWVRNLPDGSVELEAQGTEQQLNRMLEIVQRSGYIRIDWIKRKDIPIAEHENGFHIRY